MSRVELRPGLVVVAQGKAATIQECLPDSKIRVTLSGTGESLVTDLEDIEVLPAAEDVKAGQASESVFARVEEASQKEWENATILCELITRHSDGELSLEQAALEAGISTSTFYRKLRQFEKNSGPASLLRITRGRKRGEKVISSKTEEIIQAAIEEVYKGKSATISAVWRKVELLCVKEAIKVPSRTAVAARIKAIPERERHLRVHGAESANQLYGAKPGKKQVEAPLEWVQMDHTKVDVILVDEKLRRPIGRPWLTLLVDLRTRVILGYYISMYPPSTVSVASALAHAALPKNSFLRRLGLNPQIHPFYGIPVTLHLDNAKEFRTVKLVKACSARGIKVEWRPKGRKHYGGHIESLIGTMMTQYVHFLPGTTYSNTQQRKNYDSEKHAALTFKEFCKWFAGQVAIYHARHHSGLKRSPSAEWKMLFTTAGGEVWHPPLVSNPWELKLDFMPEEKRIIHPQGITLNRKWYWSNALRSYVGRRNVTVKFDPYSMATIWAKLDGSYLPINFSDATTADFAYEEYRARIIGDHLPGSVQVGGLEDPAVVPIIDQCDEIVTDAQRETKRQRRSQAAAHEHKSSAWADSASGSEVIGVTQQQEKPDYSKRATPYSRRP
ncbi:Mu transposase C-terminal domain-containing protein [Pseudomonas sp. D(2018)]|uniref:Mu transposase C-terminal domain-containing protein n=1 Tax=Pseudomonas sp. D(2018) TaxID=2502238 RepID=UPI0010F74F4E|nr:Mu transposase C-terminal domain-containing protein [Pseudomonas sp. D(2018)]